MYVIYVASIRKGRNMKISVIGVGYVGIHSVVNLSKLKQVSKVVAFDINKEKIIKYNDGIDVTSEVGNEEIVDSISNGVVFTSNESDLKDTDIFIIAVPTDASTNGELFLKPLISASSIVGNYIKENSIVVYESTVYPGLTEEICFPLLQEKTGLIIGSHFDVVYTPERVDPGNKINTVLNTPRVISGTSDSAVEIIVQLYSNYIAEMVKVSSIRVAESVKILENTQRDINIALMNNFAILMNEIDVDFREVLSAAGTKWNFQKFYPGLVGGHCIGVDPYYLIHKMKKTNVDSSFIEAARTNNEGIINYIENVITQNNPQKILFVGATFKNNCNDIRNSKNLELAYKLSNKFDVTIFDPEIEEFKNIGLSKKYDTVVVAVLHDNFDYSIIFDNFNGNLINLTNKKITNETWRLI